MVFGCAGQRAHDLLQPAGAAVLAPARRRVVDGEECDGQHDQQQHEADERAHLLRCTPSVPRRSSEPPDSVGLLGYSRATAGIVRNDSQ